MVCQTCMSSVGLYVPPISVPLLVGSVSLSYTLIIDVHVIHVMYMICS